MLKYIYAASFLSRKNWAMRYVTGVVLVLHLYSDIQYLFLCRYRQTLKRLKLNFVNSGNVSLFFSISK